MRGAVAPAAAAGVGVLVGATDELVAAPQTQRTCGLGRSEARQIHALGSITRRLAINDGPWQRLAVVPVRSGVL